MSTSSAAETPTRSQVFTIPNLISFARLATVPIFFWLFVTDRQNAAVIVYGAGAWSDFFDGYIARKTNSVSELGKILDPLADRIFIVVLVIALVIEGALPLWLAIAIVARDVLVVICFPILERKGVPRIEVNPWGKFATAALLFGLTWLALSETTWSVASAARDIGMFFTILGAVTYWYATYLYVAEIRAYFETRSERTRA